MGDVSRYFANIFSHSPIYLVCVNISHQEGYDYKICALFVFFLRRDGNERRYRKDKGR